MLARLLVSAESVGPQLDKRAGCRTELAPPDGDKKKNFIYAVAGNNCRIKQIQIETITLIMNPAPKKVPFTFGSLCF